MITKNLRISMKKNIESSFKYLEFSEIEELEKEDVNLIKKSIEAQDSSYSPYSHFRVGAAVLLENGEVISGSNQENGAFPSGLCAERVALFYAGAKYPEVPVKTIAISASHKGHQTKEPISPCGACRQVMLETRNIGKKPMKVILVGSNKIIVINDASYLLPFSFSSVIDAIK